MDYSDQMFVGVFFLGRGFDVVGVLQFEGGDGWESIGDGGGGIGSRGTVGGRPAVLGAAPHCARRSSVKENSLFIVLIS